MGFQISSPAFEEGDMIPSQYTCDGENISPPLSFAGAPPQSKSLALICDDPDAPAGNWAHWIVYDLPPAIQGLAENTPTEKVLENGAKQGKNDFGANGYGGPCPPQGTHRYRFKLYALDCLLDLAAEATRPEILGKMEGHILGEATLTGTYQRV